MIFSVWNSAAKLQLRLYYAMNATSLYLRKLFSGSRELNYGNTVLVQRDNGQWWLGYVQDIDGPNFYVDFDASGISAQWIHSSGLWPHHFLQNNLCWYTAPVHVAVRHTHADPMVFCQGTILRNKESYPFCFVCVDDPGGVHRHHVVHRNNMIAALPTPDDGENFFERITGFLYKKYVISFPRARLLLDVDFFPMFLARSCRFQSDCGDPGRDAKCRFGTVTARDQMVFVCESGRCHHRFHLNRSTLVDVGCRMFMRVSFDTITFVCVEMHGDSAFQNQRRRHSMFWDETSLRKACDDYITKLRYRRLKLALRPRLLYGSICRWISHNRQAEVEEMSITELPLPVMVSVLLYLDVDSQWRTSRVCALWRILFRQDVNQRHIVFDLCTVCEIKPYSVPDKDIHALHGIDYDTVRDYAAYLTYKVAVMLDRVSPTRTQTLALTEEGNHFHFYFDLAQRMTLTATVLFRNGVRLPLIIVRNGRDATLEWESWDAYLRETDCFLFVYMCHSGSLVCAGLPELMTVCEQLVLINFTVMHLPTQAAAWILRHDPASELPVSERALMRSEYSGVLRCPVIIPCVRFRSVESADEQARNLLATVNAHWPAVSQRVYKKVTAMHARWVRTLDYPDQWTGIRIFLQMFNPHCPDTTSQRWDSMDLRQLDIAGLNNITFAALDGLFRE